MTDFPKDSKLYKDHQRFEFEYALAKAICPPGQEHLLKEAKATLDIFASHFSPKSFSASDMLYGLEDKLIKDISGRDLLSLLDEFLSEGNGPSFEDGFYVTTEYAKNKYFNRLGTFLNEEQLRNIFVEFYNGIKWKGRNQCRFLENFAEGLWENTHYKLLRKWIDENFEEIYGIMQNERILLDETYCLIGVYSTECAEEAGLLLHKENILYPTANLQKSINGQFKGKINK